MKAKQDALIAQAETYVKLLGQENSFVQVIADYQYKSGQVPSGSLPWPGNAMPGGAFKPTPTSAAPYQHAVVSPQPTGPAQDLLNMKGMFQETHALYQQGIIDAKEYQAAQLVFSKTGPITQGDADALQGWRRQARQRQGSVRRDR